MADDYWDYGPPPWPPEIEELNAAAEAEMERLTDQELQLEAELLDKAYADQVLFEGGVK